MIRSLFLFFIVFIVCNKNLAQSSNGILIGDTTIVIYDRSIQEARLDSFRKNPAFNYRFDPEYETNILKKMWLVIRNRMDEAFSRGATKLLGKLLYYGLILAAIVGLIWIILKRSGGGVFHRNNERKQISIEEISEANTLAEIEKHLSKSIENKDYKFATRLYFLRCLRQMDDVDIIEWKSGKTNLEYLQEIQREHLKADFADLSYIYDYVWYGDFEIENEEAFNRIQRRFESYDLALTSKAL